VRIREAALLLATVVAGLATLGGATAPAAQCVYPAGYPGDSAPKQAIAAWMAGGAVEAGLPGELPVMAALVESDVKNLNSADADSLGFFQIPQRIWNSGDYAGYPDHPTLQLQWFIDQAQSARQRRIVGGAAGFGQDPAQYGEWIADVERPAQQYRGRYQPRLDEARSLIAAGCAAPPTEASPSPLPLPATGGLTPNADAQLVPESVLPSLKVVARPYQDAVRRGSVAVEARCVNESCLTRASLAFAVARRGVNRVTAAPATLKRGERRVFRLVLGKRARQVVRAAGCPLAVVRVVAANAGGYRSSASRTVRLGTRASCSRST
jgi:hypothetical protein